MFLATAIGQERENLVAKNQSVLTEMEKKIIFVSNIYRILSNNSEDIYFFTS